MGTTISRLPRLATLAALGASVAIACSGTAGGGSAPRTASAADGAYPWPVRPFHRPHPVRGNFGDPRTIFAAPPTARGLLHGGGIFLFHKGVDICAENGTAVYPVVSGTVTAVTDEFVRVANGGGREFEYWHIRSAVAPGDRVTALETVLGRVERPAAHVHLTERVYGREVNPPAAGHLTPYADTTRPRVTAVALRRPGRARTLLPFAVRGRVTLVASAEDTPELPALRHWRGMPVTPAALFWRIERWDGRVVLSTRAAVDNRRHLRPDSAFWSTYGRGTYQNMPAFGRHYGWGQRGSYVFRLAGAFDTRRLKNDVYDLVVTAVDIRGNRDSLAQRFTVTNGRRR